MKQGCSDKKRLAVKWLHLPDGRVLENQVLEWKDGKLCAHYPLTGELPFTEWYGGHFHLEKGDKENALLTDEK